MQNSFFHSLSFLIGGLLALFTISCDNQDSILNPDYNEKPKSLVRLQDENGNSYLPFLVTDDAIHVTLPDSVVFSHLRVISSNENDSLFINGRFQKMFSDVYYDLSDFTDSIFLQTRSSLGDVIMKRIVVYDFPVMVIETPGLVPIVSKEERIKDCVVTIISGGAEYN